MNIMSIDITSTMSVETKSGARTGATAGDAPACAGGLAVPGGAAVRSGHRDSARWLTGLARGPVSAGAVVVPGVGAVAAAAVQVTQVGTAAQVTQAQQILTDSRRKLYAILAADEDASEE